MFSPFSACQESRLRAPWRGYNASEVLLPREATMDTALVIVLLVLIFLVVTGHLKL
jgi:hypothetical protein